jgi:hypothetical protein
MTKNTKTILGVVAVVGIGYYIYTRNKKRDKNFSNYVGNPRPPLGFTCPRGYEPKAFGIPNPKWICVQKYKMEQGGGFPYIPKPNPPSIPPTTTPIPKTI